MARSLRAGTDATIGLVVESVADPFFSEPGRGRRAGRLGRAQVGAGRLDAPRPRARAGGGRADAAASRVGAAAGADGRRPRVARDAVAAHAHGARRPRRSRGRRRPGGHRRRRRRPRRGRAPAGPRPPPDRVRGRPPRRADVGRPARRVPRRADGARSRRRRAARARRLPRPGDRRAGDPGPALAQRLCTHGAAQCRDPLLARRGAGAARDRAHRRRAGRLRRLRDGGRAAARRHGGRPLGRRGRAGCGRAAHRAAGRPRAADHHHPRARPPAAARLRRACRHDRRGGDRRRRRHHDVQGARAVGRRAPLALVEARTRWTTTPDGGTEAEGDAFVDLVVDLLRRGHEHAEAVAGEPVRVTAVAVAGLAESGVLLDPDGRPCAPAIAWFDRRGTEQVERISSRDSGFGATFVRRTGLPWDCQASVARLLWLVDQGVGLTAGHRWASVPGRGAPPRRRTRRRAEPRLPHRPARPGHRRGVGRRRRGPGPALAPAAPAADRRHRGRTARRRRAARRAAGCRAHRRRPRPPGGGDRRRRRRAR
nr:FGGY family carbohydrate kinase [Angustibacter aerolatus]